MRSAGFQPSSKDIRSKNGYDFTSGVDEYLKLHPDPPTAFNLEEFNIFFQRLNRRRGFDLNGAVPEGAYDTQEAADLAKEKMLERDSQDEAFGLWFHNNEKYYEGMEFLKDRAVACSQGLGNTSLWTCSPRQVSHKVCGSAGTLNWRSAAYVVMENQPFLRVAVERTGGGLGRVTFEYDLIHISTDSSDVTPTANYESSQSLVMEESVVQLSFLITIHDDVIVERNETFLLQLRNVQGGAMRGPQMKTTVTIIDDDAEKLSPTQTKVTEILLPMDRQLGRASPESIDGNTLIEVTAGLPVLLLVEALDPRGNPVKNGAGAVDLSPVFIDVGESLSNFQFLVELEDVFSSEFSTELFKREEDTDNDQNTIHRGVYFDPADSTTHYAPPRNLRQYISPGQAIWGPSLSSYVEEATSTKFNHSHLGDLDLSLFLDDAYSFESLSDILHRNFTYASVIYPTIKGAFNVRARYAKSGGLLGEYYLNPFLNGLPHVRRQDHVINFNWGDRAIGGIPSKDSVSIRWTGAITVGSAGTVASAATDGTEQSILQALCFEEPNRHSFCDRCETKNCSNASFGPERSIYFHVAGGDNDQVRLWVDNKLLLDIWGREGASKLGVDEHVTIALLNSDEIYPIVLEYRHFTGFAAISLSWSLEGGNSKVVIPAENLHSLHDLPGSPLRIHVGAAQPEAKENGFSSRQDGSFVEGDGLIRGTVGETATFRIYSLDGFGNWREDLAEDDLYSVSLELKEIHAGPYRTASGAAVMERFEGKLNPGSAPRNESLLANIAYIYSEGHFLVSYIPAISGVYELFVSLFATRSPAQSGEIAEVMLQGSPYTSHISPATVSPFRSVVSGDGLTTGEAGQNSVIFILAMDDRDNPVPALDWLLASFGAVAIHQTQGTTVIGTLEHIEGPVYSVTWYPEVSGMYDVTVSSDSGEFPESPFVATVSAGPTSAARSLAVVDDDTMTAGVLSTFTIIAKDHWANLRTAAFNSKNIGNDSFSAAMITSIWNSTDGLGINLGLSKAFAEGSPSVEVNNMTLFQAFDLTHKGDEVYEISLVPMLAGEWPIVVLLDNVPVGEGRHLVKVAPGESKATTSFVVPPIGRSEPVLSVTVAGTVGTFKVQARDTAGNKQTNATQILSTNVYGLLQLQEAQRGIPDNRTATIEVSCDPEGGTGLFRCNYVAEIAGNYSLNVLLNDEEIANSPVFGIKVIPKDISATFSSATGLITLTGQSTGPIRKTGEKQDLLIRSRDDFGNDLLRGGLAERFIVTLIGADVQQEVVPTGLDVTDLENGDYAVEFTPIIAGRYRVGVEIITPGGLEGAYFSESLFVGSTAAVDKEQIVFDWQFALPQPLQGVGVSNIWSAKWAGFLRPDSTEDTIILLAAEGAARVRLFANVGSISTFQANLAAMGGSLERALEEEDEKPIMTLDLWKEFFVADSLGFTNVSEQITFSQVQLHQGEFYPILIDFQRDIETSVPAKLELRYLTVEVATDSGSVPKTIDNETIDSLSQPIPPRLLFPSRSIDRLQGSPFSPVVFPNRTFPLSSIAQGDGLRSGTVGMPTVFRVMLKDFWGNAVIEEEAANSTVTALALLTESLDNVRNSTDGITLISESTFAGDAQHVIQLNPTVPGFYLLYIFVNVERISPDQDDILDKITNYGQTNGIQGSPFNLRVDEDIADANSTIIFGERTERAIAGQLSTFSIQTIDSFGNNRSTPVAGGVSGTLERAGALSDSDYLSPNGMNNIVQLGIENLGNGSYSATYRVYISGRYRIRIVSGLKEFVHPQLLIVIDELASAAETVIQRSVLRGEPWIAGTPKTFKLNLRDRFRNPLTRGTDKIIGRASGPGREMNFFILNVTNPIGSQPPSNKFTRWWENGLTHAEHDVDTLIRKYPFGHATSSGSVPLVSPTDEWSRRYLSFWPPAPGLYELQIWLLTGFENGETPFSFVRGLLGEYFNNFWWRGDPLITRIDTSSILAWTPDAFSAAIGTYFSPEFVKAASNTSTPSTLDGRFRRICDLLTAGGRDCLKIPASKDFSGREDFSTNNRSPFFAFTSTALSIRWTAYFEAPSTAIFRFLVYARTRARLSIEDEIVVDTGFSNGDAQEGKYSKALFQGQLYRMRLEYQFDDGPFGLSVAWSWKGDLGSTSRGFVPLDNGLLFPMREQVLASPFYISVEDSSN